MFLFQNNYSIIISNFVSWYRDEFPPKVQSPLVIVDLLIVDSLVIVDRLSRPIVYFSMYFSRNSGFFRYSGQFAADGRIHYYERRLYFFWGTLQWQPLENRQSPVNVVNKQFSRKHKILSSKPHLRTFKLGTVWPCVSRGIKNTIGQSWKV